MRPLDAPYPDPQKPCDGLQNSSQGPTRTHVCRNPACGTEFAHRVRGGNQFCSAECRFEMTQNARSAIRHLKGYQWPLSRRDFIAGMSAKALMIPLASFRESLPEGLTARRERIWGELCELDSLMLTKGPITPALRSSIRTRAEVISATLSLEKPRSLADRSLLNRTRELLRDVGAEGPLSVQNLRVLLGHAEAVVRFFMEIRDFPNLGRSLVALGNIYRLAEDEHQGLQKFLWAFHILREKCSLGDPAVARLLHQVRFWRLRRIGNDLERSDTRREIARLTQLAERVDDASIWVEHYREEAGFANYLLGDDDLALKRLGDLQLARRRLVDHTTFADPTLLTPKIEFLFAKHRDEESVDLIRRQYLPLYLENPHVYYHRRILRWAAEHKFEVGFLPPPEYSSAFLSYLPRS